MKPINKSHTRSQTLSTIKSYNHTISPMHFSLHQNVIHSIPKVHNIDQNFGTITSDSLEFQDEIKLDIPSIHKVELFKSLSDYVNIQLSEFHLNNILKDEI